jgi:hypothetical protein
MKPSLASREIDMGPVDFGKMAFGRSKKFNLDKIAPLVSKRKAKPGVGQLKLDLESAVGRRVGLSSSCAREGMTQP